MRVDVDDPGSVAFAASCFRGGTSGHVWDSYWASLPPDHVVTWAEFKKTLRNDLGYEEAFIDKTSNNSLARVSANVASEKLSRFVTMSKSAA